MTAEATTMRRLLCLTLLALAAVSPSTSEAQECEADGTCSASAEPECGVYMAPSTIGVANMGIYTGIPLEKGVAINYPEIVVPLMFRSWGKHGKNPDGSLWDRYIWDGPVVDVEPRNNDLDRDDTGAAFIPGVGCTINSRLDLFNIDTCHGSIYDTAGLHRSRDPGAGAFSPYHSSETTTRREIPAGSELLGEYGSEWIPDIPDAVITFNDNMNTADEFLEEYAEWVQAKKLPDTVADALWNLTWSMPPGSQVLGNLPHQPWKAVVNKLQDEDEKSVIRYFHREQGKRSLEWLKEHGKCQDHMKPGNSTIPQAGRGAFATRDLPKGTVVGYAPLIHMGNNRELWDISYGKRGRTKRPKYIQQDLVINYSFGHRDSTLLLTPYGAMVNFINHDKERANVKVQWPDKELVAHKPDWLTKDLDFLIHTYEKIGLSFDYVALRDIKEGEEIFMDYGDEWQAAWDEHVRTWNPPEGAQDYIHASEWEGPLLTLEEQKKTPYPFNLHTLCIDSFTRDRIEGGYKFTKVLRETPLRIHCQVLERTQDEDGEYLYTVQYEYEDDDEDVEPVIVKKVPSPDGIQLTDKVRTADWHLENAFRHEIMVPDDLFPETWKNRK